MNADEPLMARKRATLKDEKGQESGGKGWYKLEEPW
jgi:hypothetical protein